MRLVSADVVTGPFDVIVRVEANDLGATGAGSAPGNIRARAESFDGDRGRLGAVNAPATSPRTVSLHPRTP